MLQRLLCLFGRHRPDRHHVRWEDDSFVAKCKGCGRRMSREFEGWTVVTRE